MKDSGENTGLRDRATARMDVRAELSRLERLIEELRIDYEQFFLGLQPRAPDQAYREVKNLIRAIMKAPYKSSEMNYRLRSLESRFRTYNSYWERVNKQRESGTYKKDVFKADMRDRHSFEDTRSETRKGRAEKSMHDLYRSYKKALEKETGKKQKVDYSAFQKSLLRRSKECREKYGDRKVSFKVIVKDGKVSLRTKVAKDS